MEATQILTLEQAFDLALQHHQSGHLAEAEALYRQILIVQPEHFDAMHNLGIIAHQTGRHEVASELINRVIVLCPNAPVAHSNLGEIYLRMGRLDEAVAACRRAVQLDPNCAGAYNNLGNALRELGDEEAAVIAFRRALEINADFVEAHYNLGLSLGRDEESIAALNRALDLKPKCPNVCNDLGNALKERGDIEGAAAAYRQALELKSDFAEAHNNLGFVFTMQGHIQEAIAEFRTAIELKPALADAYNNLAIALHKLGQRKEAIALLHHALQLRSDHVDAQSNLGALLKEEGDLDEAAIALHRALQLNPNHVQALNNLGAVLTEQGHIDGAVDSYRRALKLAPDCHEAKVDLSMLLLLSGDFESGWPLYEARLNYISPGKRKFSQPQWNGEDVLGKRVLVHAEQGFGDSIQFIRYARLIAERGADVIVECQIPLVNLLRGVKDVAEVFALGEALPRFDLHVPMLSQPLIFQTRPESIPAEVPYIFAEPTRCSVWARRLCNRGNHLKVGLAWAGNPAHRSTRARDILLSMLRPLLGVAGVEFFSLQVGFGSEQIQFLPDSASISDCTCYIQEFADTAALMMQLDLVVSVDTAAAHLAGALGRPVWTLLPFVPDWRWGLGGERTPWYPTMRLFRQSTRNDWAPVIQRVCGELEGMVKAKNNR